MFFYVFVITAAAVVVQRLLTKAEARPSRATQAPDDAIALVIQPRLMGRLPQAARHRILRLSGRDHQVEVTTQAGVTSLRLRLRDAIAEMEPVEGYSTHRSHWVAKDAVTGVAREGSQKLYLVLCNGDRVPVSRTYRPALEQAGLIDPPQDRPPPPEAVVPPAPPARSEPPLPPGA